MSLAPTAAQPAMVAASPRDGARVAARRREQIAKDAEAIRAECQAAAGGDWDRWESQTESHRSALKARLAALKNYDQPKGWSNMTTYDALEGSNGFPLFEIGARQTLAYLVDPKPFAGLRAGRPVVAAQRWLHERGIDLMLVVVPTMPDVYVEKFVEPCPPDGIIAPHVRATFLDMMASDVEVVDGWRLFRELRGGDYLYNTADHHWTPRGMREMAKEIARRLARFDVASNAMVGERITKGTPEPYRIQGCHEPGIELQMGWCMLSEEQRQRARAAHPATADHITYADGSRIEDDRGSPVLLIGNSFVEGLQELLVQALNLGVACDWESGSTTQQFGEFLREPERLQGVRVVIWVTTEYHMTTFFPMPAPILATLDKSKYTGGDSGSAQSP
jgi:hypothetical protein